VIGYGLESAFVALRRPQRAGKTAKPVEPEPEPGPGLWTLQLAEAADGSCPYETFLGDLDEYSFTVLDIAVRTFLGRQGHNVCGTEWGKSLGGGLYEFRVRRPLNTLCNLAGIDVPVGLDADRKILLRVFFAVEGERIVLLLGGYDKGDDPSDRRQNKEIKRARSLLTEHKEARRRERGQPRRQDRPR
jgi:hypothetical protein